VVDVLVVGADDVDDELVWCDPDPVPVPVVPVAAAGCGGPE
jgi:hypothetical protein